MGRHPDIRVVGATAETRRAYELACAFEPDLLVSELILGDSDAFAVARELRRRRLGVGVAVLTMQASPAFVREAAAAGIRGYILKSQPLREVVVGLERAAVDFYFAPAVGGPPENVPGAAAPDLLGRLSAREQEIFCRVLAGDTNRQVAQSLFIRPPRPNGRSTTPCRLRAQLRVLRHFLDREPGVSRGGSAPPSRAT
jgi:DNA-binding NarL/FixJ family response regulator